MYVIPMAEPMRTISLKLPEDLDRVLSKLAKRRGSTRSALLREAVEVLIRQHASSVGELADDLAGSLSGPKDLSSAAKHLAGYGE
jgi:metal-responsive CopG/Arc/MetJ family transcriptional regulator